MKDVAVLMFALAACGPAPANPPRLWLSPNNGSETDLYLGESEPRFF